MKERSLNLATPNAFLPHEFTSGGDGVMRT